MVNKRGLVVETSLELIYILPCYFYLVHVIYYFYLTKIYLFLFHILIRFMINKKKTFLNGDLYVLYNVKLCYGVFQCSVRCTKKNVLLPGLWLTLISQFQENVNSFNFLAKVLTANQRTLLLKLEYYNIRVISHDLIKSNLTNRKHTHINSVDSSTLTSSHGIPQGSVLGSLVFLIVWHYVQLKLLYSFF